MKWTVPGDPEKRLFDDKYPALARAWELTPLGEHRAEPVQVSEQAPSRPRRIIDGPIYAPEAEYEFGFEVTDLKFSHRFEDEVDVYADDLLVSTRSVPTGVVDVTAEMIAPYGVKWDRTDAFRASVKERLDEYLKAKGYNYDRLEVGHIDHHVGTMKGHRIIVQAIALVGGRS